jgi:alpha-tubulin suppressor-like RCC1 family protein
LLFYPSPCTTTYFLSYPFSRDIKPDGILFITGHNLSISKKILDCTSVLSFGKADFTLGVPLPNSVADVRPRLIETLTCESIIQLVASRYHSLALTKEGEVYSWGHGRAGRFVSLVVICMRVEYELVHAKNIQNYFPPSN